MSDRLNEYLEEENKEIDATEEEFEKFLMDADSLPLSNRAERLRYLVDIATEKKRMFAKYNNFIMDIRKPSFSVFCLWLIFSLIGFFGTIVFISYLIFK